MKQCHKESLDRWEGVGVQKQGREGEISKMLSQAEFCGRQC